MSRQLDSELEIIVKRLDVLIRFELEKQKARTPEITVGDQIGFLEATGLAGKDVASILGLDVGQLPAYRRYSKKGKTKGKKGGAS